MSSGPSNSNSVNDYMNWCKPARLRRPPTALTLRVPDAQGRASRCQYLVDGCTQNAVCCSETSVIVAAFIHKSAKHIEKFIAFPKINSSNLNISVLCNEECELDDVFIRQSVCFYTCWKVCIAERHQANTKSHEVGSTMCDRPEIK